MSYRLVRGEVHIHYPDQPRQGPQPDGDTVRFRPDHPMIFDQLTRTGGVAAAFNARGMVNLRLDAIDALELHYEGTHQHPALAVAARTRLLAELGFGQVNFFADSPLVVQAVEHHPRRAYLLTRSIDRYGRVIAFLCPGDRPEADGAEIFLQPRDIDPSVNAVQLREGAVYPAFYTSLPADLREHLAAIAAAARAAGRGLWPQDQSVPPRRALVRALADAEQLALWPKLFRRLATYFGAGYTGLAQFDAWLRANPNQDDRVLLPRSELGHLHNVIAVQGDEIRLRFAPEEIVIVDATNTPPEGTPPSSPPARAQEVRIVAALVNPRGAEAGAETVTVLNTSASDLDLAGWELRDRAGGRLPVAARLRAGEALRVRLDQRLRLANGGDTLSLVAGSTLVDQVTYTAREAAQEGVTILFKGA